MELKLEKEFVVISSACLVLLLPAYFPEHNYRVAAPRFITFQDLPGLPSLLDDGVLRRPQNRIPNPADSRGPREEEVSGPV